MKQYLEFSVWLMEQSKEHGFYYLGDGQFRYNYRSPYSIEDLFNFYSRGKTMKKDLSIAHQPIDEKELKIQQSRAFEM